MVLDSNEIDDKVIEAMIQSGEVSQQLMDFIKAKVKEDKNKQIEERKREDELLKKRERAEQ